MRAFQTVFAALAAAAVNGQVVTRTSNLGGLYGGLSYGGLSYGSGLYGLSYGSPAVSYGARYSTLSAAPAVSYGARYSTVSAAPAVSYGVSRGVSYGVAAPAAVSYGVAAPAAVSYGVAAPAVSRVHTVSAAPAVTRVHTVSAAPAVSYGLASRSYSVAAPATTLVHAAPAVSTVHHGVGQAVNVGVVAQAPSATVKTHEVHTSSGQQAIHIQDFQAGDQVIRVHEGPQAAPEIAQVAVPGEQHHLRVVEHQTGPAHVERTVHRAETQVVDLQKAGRPGARIVQVVRGQSPAPSVEFVSDGGSSHHVYYADDVSGAGAVAGATTFHSAYAPSVSGAVVSSPAVSTVHAAPAAAVSYGVTAAPAAVSYGVSTAPAVSYATRSVVAAPAVTRVHTVTAPAPAVSYGVSTAPVSTVSYGVAAPVSTGYYGAYNPGYYGSYSLGGFRYGGLGYSTGYSSYGTGNNVYLKKSAAKKSA